MNYSDNLNSFWTLCYKGTYIHGCSGRVGENIRVHQKYFKSVRAAKAWITRGLNRTRREIDLPIA